MKTKRFLIALNVLVIAILACSAPGSFFNPHDAAATNTALAATLQARGIPPPIPDTPDENATFAAHMLTQSVVSRAGTPSSGGLIVPTLKPAGLSDFDATNTAFEATILVEYATFVSHLLTETARALTPTNTQTPKPTLMPLLMAVPAAGHKPAAPQAFQVNFKCVKATKVYDVHATLTWNDVAINEDGYLLSITSVSSTGKHLSTQRQLAANSHGFADTRKMEASVAAGRPRPTIEYELTAFNGLGASSAVSKTISCFK